MPNQRQIIMRSLYDDFTGLNPELVNSVNGLRHESVLEEEKRAVPIFFKQEDGIYSRLLARHPLFASASTAEQAENKAINDMLAQIQKRLSKSKDLLNNNQEVGQLAAQQAVDDPKKRYRREYLINNGCTWDEIGRYHSALRLLLNDNTLHPNAFWNTRYFDGISSFNRKTYRHYLALIWEAATKETLEAPIYCPEMSDEELRESAIEQIVSVLAQCRREHNFDKKHPDWNQTQEPRDAQRCDLGLRGDLFGQMLIYNEYYMQTHANLNIRSLGPIIQDIIFEEFTQLESNKKSKIIYYLEKKGIILIDPEDQETAALNQFINDTKIVAWEKLLQKLNKASPDSPLYKINSFLKSIDEKINQNQADAIIGSTRIVDNLNNWIALELESLRLTEKENVASSDYIRRFAQDAISQIFKNLVQDALNADADRRTLLAEQFITLNSNIFALEYRLDKMVISATAFPEASITAETKHKYLQCIHYYETNIAAMGMQIRSIIESYNSQSQQSVNNQFVLAEDKEIAPLLVRQRHQFLLEHQHLLESLKTKLANLKRLIEHEDVTKLRPYLQTWFNFYPEDRLFSPHFYAEYLWKLLLEKTPSARFIIGDSLNQELQDTIDLIFGNPRIGIRGLDTVQQNLVMYAFNLKVQLFSLLERNRYHHYWQLVKDNLAIKQLDLGKVEYSPNPHVITLMETAYQASNVPTSKWRTIIERSGKQIALEDSVLPGLIEQRRLHLRQEEHYSKRMINAAASLPLSLYGDEIDTERQSAALDIWVGIAQSIFDHGEDINILINFVTQTIMMQLDIGKFAKDDQEVLKKIVKLYTGIEEDAFFPLPFYIQKTTAIVNIANHIVLMITTLSSPAIKTCFSQGLLRLMSRERALEVVESDKNTYIIRLSNLEPYKLVLTYWDKKSINFYIPSHQSQTVLVANQGYPAHTYPGDTLLSQVYPLITNPYDLCLSPDANEEKLEQGKIYIGAKGHLLADGLRYQVLNRWGEILSGEIDVPLSHAMADQTVTITSLMNFKPYILAITSQREHTLTKKPIVSDLTLANMTDIVFQERQYSGYLSEYDSSIYVFPGSRSRFFPTVSSAGLRRAISQIDSNLNALPESKCLNLETFSQQP